MKYEAITDRTRDLVNQFMKEQWYSTNMVLRGQVYDLSHTDGIVVLQDNLIIGLVTYRIFNQTCEIMSLDSLNEGKGIGTELVTRVISIAKEEGCNQVVLITTNDNINAIRFYQKRGFDMARLYHNALDESRKLKPEIPMIGENDIPLRHEIEFELKITN